MNDAPQLWGLECSGDRVRALKEALQADAWVLERDDLMEEWYPIELVLDALRTYGTARGTTALIDVGRRFQQQMRAPRACNMLEALYNLDISYHLGHRLRGRLMFDVQAGRMVEGIDHYLVARVGSHDGLRVYAPHLYPCAFSFGLVSCVAESQESTATTQYEENAPSHIYRVRW